MSAQLLLRVSGNDGPGITASITECIAQANGKILDIEQAVTHGLLSLLVLVEVDDSAEKDLETNIRSHLKSFSLEINFSKVEGAYNIGDPAHRFVATIMANEIPTNFFSQITKTLAESSFNIDLIRKLSSGGLATIELTCSSKARVNLSGIKEKLLGITTKYPGVDIAVQKENIYRRSKRLVVFDMDSTLTQGEVIDELAELVGKKAEVSDLTKRAMNGEMDFQESLIRRVALLRGLSRKDLDYVAANMKLTPGASMLVKVLKHLGYRIAIISGGFSYFVDRLKNDLGIHYAYSNSLEMDGDTLTGRLQGLIVDGRRKADLLDLLSQQEGVSLDQVIAIGDGANDIMMLKKAGLGIAFNPKAFTKAIVGTSVTNKSMESILYLLGITEQEVAELGIR